MASAHKRKYPKGSTIIYAGEESESIYYIVKGSVTVLIEDDSGREIIVAYLNEGDFFGEMALFDNEVRSATARALGRAKVLTVTRSNLLRRIHADPAMALRILETMSRRIRDLNSAVSQLQAALEDQE